MKIIKYISALAMLVLFISSCELDIGETYNNDYAQEWFMTTYNQRDDLWDVVRLDLSDRSFEVSETTLDDGANLSEYKGTTRGSIKQISSTTLTMTVEEFYIGSEWYSRADYITYMEDAGQADKAADLADDIFITTLINYSINNAPTTLIIAGSNDFSGNYYSSVMASVLNE